MAKKYSFKDSICPFCRLDLAGKQSFKLVDGKGACPQCAHSLELKVETPATEPEETPATAEETPATAEETPATEPEKPEQEPEPETPPEEE